MSTLYSGEPLKYDMSGTRLYRIWNGIKGRCRDINNAKYGGRGISFCEEWLSFEVFADWAIKSGYSDELTIERIDNDGDYTPSNCTWLTIKEQANNRRNSRKIYYNGSGMNIAQLSRLTGVKYGRLYQRIFKYGYSVEDAVKKG